MSFSVKQIKAILSSHNMPVEDLDGATEEICGRHSADLDSIKEERDNLKKDIEALNALKDENEQLKNQLAEKADKDYDSLKAEFDQYKADVEKEKTHESKKAAYVELLKDAGIKDDKHIATVLKYTDIDSKELDDKGKIKSLKEDMKTIKEDWSHFIVSQSTQGAPTATPPASTGGTIAQPSRAAQMAAQFVSERYGTASKTE